MKKWIRSLAPLAAAALLLFSAITAAAAEERVTVTVTAGSWCRVLIPVPNGETLREHTVLEGEAAPGMVLRAEGTGLALVGTPAQAGRWDVLVSAKTDSETVRFWIEQFVVSSEPTPAPTAAPTATPAPTEAPKATAAPAGTPEPTLAPAPEGLPEITKDPTAESVLAGGTAIFVARASNAVSLQWILTDPMDLQSLDVSAAAQRFPGITVYGAETETLAISGMPEELDGWQMECRFTGPSGAVATSARALITVKPSPVSAPIFLTQPAALDLYDGETPELSAEAIVFDEAEVRYQWYTTSEFNIAAAREIEGATGPEFAPPRLEGTFYYCVAAKSVKGWEESALVFSELVPVTVNPGPRVHVHDFSGPWYWNEQTHWHACACGQRQDEAAHEFLWEETEATAFSEGQRTGVCAVCGYRVSETLKAGPLSKLASLDMDRLLLAALAAVVAAVIVIAIILMARAGAKKKKRRPPRSGTYHGTHLRK